MTTTPHLNFVGGEWCASGSAALNLHPSDVTDAIGEYAEAGAAVSRQPSLDRLAR